MRTPRHGSSWVLGFWRPADGWGWVSSSTRLRRAVSSDEVAEALKMPRRHTPGATPATSPLHAQQAAGDPRQPPAAPTVDIGAGHLAKLGRYHLMRTTGVRMKVAQQRIGAREGTPGECTWLNEPLESPLLTTERANPCRHCRPANYQFSVKLVGR